MSLFSFARSMYNVAAHYMATMNVNTLSTHDQDSYTFCLHQLWRSLSRGSNSTKTPRPPLPTELIITIFRLADCCILIPSLSASIPEHEPIPMVRSQGPLAFQPWISTPPIREPMLSLLRTSIARLEIEIVSKDQGWASQHSASYSWFEIGLYNNNGEVNELGVVMRDGKETPLVWAFRHNEIAGRHFKRETSILDASHEVWRYLEEGDVLCVRICAQYPAWENYAKEGHLRFFRYFEPGQLCR